MDDFPSLDDLAQQTLDDAEKPKRSPNAPEKPKRGFRDLEAPERTLEDLLTNPGLVDEIEKPKRGLEAPDRRKRKPKPRSKWRLVFMFIGTLLAFLLLMSVKIALDIVLTDVGFVGSGASTGDGHATFIEGLAPLSFGAKLGDRLISVAPPPFPLEDGGGAELVCRNNQLEWRVIEPGRFQARTLGRFIGLRNECQERLLLKTCWFKSFLAIAFAPYCDHSTI